MTVKLSKEQSAKVLDLFRSCTKHGIVADIPVTSLDFTLFEQKIKNLTKKEFPAYQYICTDDSDHFINISLFCEGDESSEKVIQIKTYSGYANFFESEFRGFAKGCNQIVEWLNKNKHTSKIIADED